MKTLRTGLVLWIVGCLPPAVLSPVLWGEEIVDPVSDSGLRCYAQGGVVVDGIAYFTSSDGGGVKTDEPDAFPAVVAFDLKTFKKLRTYRFARTYDSSPFLFQKKDGTWLIIAHEHLNKQTVALRTATSGEVEWKSLANQPGTYFFGHTFFEREDGTAIIYTRLPERTARHFGRNRRGTLVDQPIKHGRNHALRPTRPTAAFTYQRNGTGLETPSQRRRDPQDGRGR